MEQLIKKTCIQNCYGCKWFRATYYPNPKPGLLPRDRTEQVLPFEMVDIDYAGPLYYKSKSKKDLNHLSYYFTVVLAELYIWSQCLILSLPTLSKVLRDKFQGEESQTSYIPITQKALRKKQSG